jgi:hypothetical protein
MEAEERRPVRTAAEEAGVLEAHCANASFYYFDTG